MKKMVKEIVALEKQYWILIDVPKQEPSESQMDFIVRILNCLDQRLQAASNTGAQQAKMTGIASLFAGSTQLSDRSKDALLLEQVKSKSTDELRKENTALQNEFYKLLRKYCGLKALATQMRIDFESTRLYPIIPRYSMLKHMIKSALRSPTFMEVCHEQDDF
uniref:Uncharacterized protein n=1 Tax=Romanomermis culicivorax TaxID=13658 RepID=A0A915K6X9_ROMCU